MEDHDALVRRALYGGGDTTPAPLPPGPIPEPAPEDRSALFARAIFGAGGVATPTAEGAAAVPSARGPSRILGRLAAAELTLLAAARELGIPAAAVRTRVADGSLRSVHRGRRDYVRWADLVGYSRRVA